MLKLIDDEEKYLDEYNIAYQTSLQKIEQGLMKKHALMFLDISIINIIQQYKDNRDRNKLPEGWVPSYDYFLVDDDKFIK